MLMPGMLTDEQMKQLDAGAGHRVRPAVPHLHDPAPPRRRDDGEGAVRHATAPAQDETVFKFASDVNVDQTTEIARMEQMLAAPHHRTIAVTPRSSP